MKKNLSALLLICVVALTGCSYTGGIENPIQRKFSWFSYVNGDDIRKVCSTLGADKYRIVYNGIYQYQTRAYDVSFLAKKMRSVVTGDASLSSLDIKNPLGLWAGKNEWTQLSESDLQKIKSSIIASGALTPAPDGLRLYSDKFYWTVASCVDGQFYFNAYLWNTPRWQHVKFDKVLLDLDATKVEFQKPRRISRFEIWGSEQEADPFLLEVGKNGLVGFEGS